jgi:AcrR family transcriptional regulator
MMTPRERIAAAATKLFARHGVEGVGLQQIADEVGLHKSSLFHHYKGKLELAAEVFNAAVAPVVDIIKPLTTDDPPSIDCFLSVTDALVDHFSDHPDAARIIVYAMSSPHDSPLRAPTPDGDLLFTAFYTTIWSWLDRATKAGTIRALNIRQTIFNLIGLMLFYPAVALDEREVAGPTPFSPSARKHRKAELHHTLRGLFAH